MKDKRRICVLVDGLLDVFNAKTTAGLLRYCPEEVVAVLDRKNAGKDLEQFLGVGKGVPIIDSIEAAKAFKPNILAIGVALPGGAVPDAWRRIIIGALKSGMDILNGLHTILSEDPELAECAAQAGQTITDVRKAPPGLTVGKAKALTTRGKRILTIGTDCNLGKRVTALELVREMKSRGINAESVPTGQTGVMINGSGVIVDSVISDFVSGAVEGAILEKKDADYIVIEGQGSLLHPSYSAVTLGLMHGSLPDYMILCHTPLRETMRSTDNIPMPSLSQMIFLSEALIKPLNPQSKVIGVSLNCHGWNDEQARAAREEAAEETGLVVVDAIRTGTADLVAAICEENI